MNSIAFDVENEKRFSSRIQIFFKRYQISSVLKRSNAYKEQGFSVIALIHYLFCLVFRNRSMFLDMQSEKAPEFRKDTVYRLKNATHIDWKRFTTALASRIITDTIEPLTSENRKNAFINESYDVVSNSNGAKAWKFAMKKATEVIPQLISYAMEAGIRANYVLFDSWFSSPKAIRSMKKLGVDVVAMVKNSKIHYCFQNRMYPCKDIFRCCKHRRGRSRYLLRVPIKIRDTDENAAPCPMTQCARRPPSY